MSRRLALALAGLALALALVAHSQDLARSRTLFRLRNVTTARPRDLLEGNRQRYARRRRRPTTSTTPATTTTSTAAPIDYYSDYDEYYDDYDDYHVTTTTTTTTTPAPRRRGRPGRRRRTTTTTTTTTTTLSPGYRARPDGRVIDYLADPNFPFELRGADLTEYPFFVSIPESGFECRGRHDGYYADVELRCQVYHHCASGHQRYDFLCPNYTLFDQTTFTCRFVNTVDCPRSEEHYARNNALYVESTTAGAPSGHLSNQTQSR